MDKPLTLVRSLLVMLMSAIVCMGAVFLLASATSKLAYEEDFGAVADSSWSLQCNAPSGEHCFPVDPIEGLDWEWIPHQITFRQNQARSEDEMTGDSLPDD